MSEVVSYAVGELDPFARSCGRGGLPPATGSMEPNRKRPTDQDIYLHELKPGMTVVPLYGTPWKVKSLSRRNGNVYVHAENGDCMISHPQTRVVTVRRPG